MNESVVVNNYLKMSGNVRRVRRFLYFFFKRLFDVVASVIGLVVLLPIIIIIGLLIKLEDRGTIFFKHKRVGKNGKTIYLYKFRSMVMNAEELLNVLTDEQRREYEENYKLDDDFRITKIGNILRKTSLDEIPQLINILKGDMSFVGPRPVVLKELDKYGEDKDKFLSITPGLTGWWACSGRSVTTYDERKKLELYYIDNCSVLLDIKCLLKTAVVVIERKGAK